MARPSLCDGGMFWLRVVHAFLRCKGCEAHLNGISPVRTAGARWFSRLRVVVAGAQWVDKEGVSLDCGGV